MPLMRRRSADMRGGRWSASAHCVEGASLDAGCVLEAWHVHAQVLDKGCERWRASYKWGEESSSRGAAAFNFEPAVAIPFDPMAWARGGRKMTKMVGCEWQFSLGLVVARRCMSFLPRRMRQHFSPHPQPLRRWRQLTRRRFWRRRQP